MKSFSHYPLPKFLILLSVALSIVCVYLCIPNCSKHKKQTDITECMRYADQHWSKEKYTQWLVDSLGISSDTAIYWNQERQEWTYLSHHLPDSKTQQYYQMIGKYEQFRWGWDDYDDYTQNSQNRAYYLECRSKSY